MKIHPFWPTLGITLLVGIAISITIALATSEPEERIVTIGGEKMAFTIEDAKIWKCGSLELISLHLPTESGVRGTGTVLLDNSNAGPKTKHYRKGLEKVWTWHLDTELGGYNYMVLLKPNNNANYYDFSGLKKGESTKPSMVYPCKQISP